MMMKTSKDAESNEDYVIMDMKKSILLVILGLSGIVTPLGINGDLLIDIWIMIGVTVFALGSAITFGHVSKKEGFALVLMYATYLIYIILRAVEVF